LTSGAKKERQNSLRLFCRFNHYFAVDLVMIMPYLGKQTLSHLHVNAAIYFAQMLKIFARKMANFSALGMRPHPLHCHTIRLCTSSFWFCADSG